MPRRVKPASYPRFWSFPRSLSPEFLNRWSPSSSDSIPALDRTYDQSRLRPSLVPAARHFLQKSEPPQQLSSCQTMVQWSHSILRGSFESVSNALRSCRPVACWPPPPLQVLASYTGAAGSRARERETERDSRRPRRDPRQRHTATSDRPEVDVTQLHRMQRVLPDGLSFQKKRMAWHFREFRKFGSLLPRASRGSARAAPRAAHGRRVRRRSHRRPKRDK